MPEKQLLQSLLDLQDKYSHTFRAIVTAERLRHTLADGGPIDVEAERVRESLIEHVGQLPIIASFLHPHIEHRDEVDLGRVLIMLSIHDIGETVVGDVITFKKTEAHADVERKAAAGLLPPDLMLYFDEFEAQESLDAKFAKSVDRLGPLLHEITMPNLTMKRFVTHGFDSAKIEKKGKGIFSWDVTLHGIFNEIMDAYRNIERNEPTGYRGRVDLE